MKRLPIIILAFVPLLTWATIRIVSAERFDIFCGDYIARAATANTVPLAKENLSKAIAYLTENNMTEGYTSVLYNSPSEDVGFFYNNLSQSEAVLDRVPPNADELTISNTLLKLHNSLTVQGKEGSGVIHPEGISIYPHNGIANAFGWVSAIFAIIGLITLISSSNEW